MGHAVGGPALLVTADGSVLAVNPAAARRLPDVTPGLDLGDLVVDRPSWQRFLSDMAVSTSAVLSRITFGAPSNLVCLVARGP